MTLVVNYLIEHWVELINGLIVGVILIGPTVLITQWATPSPVRQRRQIRNRKKRLEAELEAHRDDMENPGRALARVLSTFFYQFAAQLTTVYASWVILRVIDRYFIDLSSDTINLSTFIFFAPVIYYAWQTYGDVWRIGYPNTRERALEKQIEELEADSLGT